MDWCADLERIIGPADLGRDKADGFFEQFRVGGWINDPSPLEDLPIVTPADGLSGNSYGNNAYGKPALGYLALKELLGDAEFGRALHGFMDRWHGKHPIPWDFFNTVNNVTGRNLNWFWNSWYFSNNYIDLAVAGGKKNSDGYTIIINKNCGKPTAPAIEGGDGGGMDLGNTEAPPDLGA